MKQTQSFITGLYLIFSYWIRTWQKEYYINIRGCYAHMDTGEFIVRYQIANTRVVSAATLKNFLNSELIHYVPPQQLYQLGFSASEVGRQQQAVKQAAAPSLSRRIVRRFFFHE